MAKATKRATVASDEVQVYTLTRAQGHAAAKKAGIDVAALTGGPDGPVLAAVLSTYRMLTTKPGGLAKVYRHTVKWLSGPGQDVTTIPLTAAEVKELKAAGVTLTLDG